MQNARARIRLKLELWWIEDRCLCLRPPARYWERLRDCGTSGGGDRKPPQRISSIMAIMLSVGSGGM
jgi:hypothetical protein